MNLKRGLLIAIAAYIVSSLIGIGAAYVLGVGISDSGDVPTSIWVVGLVATFAIAYGATYAYFYDRSVRPSMREGMRFGLLLFIVSFILDISLVLVYINQSGTTTEILNYYLDPLFWVMVLILLGTCTFVGALLAGGSSTRSVRSAAPRSKKSKRTVSRKKPASKKKVKRKRKKR